MASPLSPSADTSDATARLAAARERVRSALAGAAAAFPGGGDAWTPPRAPLRAFLTSKASVAPQYRVFRHDGLGLHFVLRDVESLSQHTCVFGPTGTGGEPVTFAEAVAFAHQAFAAWSREHLVPALGETAPAAVEDVAVAAERLVKMYGTPAPGG